MAALYKQGDLVKLFFDVPLPDGTFLNHPVLIISSNRANSYEHFYTGIMMTGSSYTDAFSFKVENNMFESKLDKSGCHLRMFITVRFCESQIEKLKTRMLKPFFSMVLKQVKELVFCID